MGNRKGKSTHGVKGRKPTHGGTNPKSSSALYSGKYQFYTKFLDTEKKSNSTEKKSNISSKRDSVRNQQNSTVDQDKLLSILHQNRSMLANIDQKALKEQFQKREKEQLQKRKKEQALKLEQEQLQKRKKEQEQALEQARKRKQEQALKLKKEQEQALEQARKRKQEQALNNLNIEFTSLNEDVHEINLQVDVIQKYLPTKASNEFYGFILTNGKISIEQLIEIIKNNALSPLQQQDSSTSKGISIKSLYIIEKKNNNSHCTFRQKIVDQFTTNTENYDKDNMNVYLYIYDKNVATER